MGKEKGSLGNSFECIASSWSQFQPHKLSVPVLKAVGIVLENQQRRLFKIYNTCMTSKRKKGTLVAQVVD